MMRETFDVPMKKMTIEMQWVNNTETSVPEFTKGFPGT